MCGGMFDRFDNFRMGMTGDKRPPGTDIIYVPVSVRIPEMAALGMIGKEGIASYRPECPCGGIHSADTYL